MSPREREFSRKSKTSSSYLSSSDALEETVAETALHINVLRGKTAWMSSHSEGVL
jgi:hypothetical protein